MKRLFVILFFSALVSCQSNSGSSFSVEGQVSNSNAGSIYLEQNIANRERPLIVDSATIGSDGKFRLSTTTKEEGIFSLRAGAAELPFAVLVNDVKKLTVDANLLTPGNYTVKGSPASEALIQFDKNIGRHLELLSRYNMHYDSVSGIRTSDPAMKKAVDSMRSADSLHYETTTNEMKNDVVTLAEKSNSPALLIYAISTFQQIADRYGFRGFNPTEVAVIVNKAITRFPDNATLQEWKKTLRPGMAPDFTLADTTGKPLSLSSLKGKFVLIDFWASWCKPCRLENPNIVAAYNQFREKNFTILGVSLDTSRVDWINAVHADGLGWSHVSDLNGWKSPVAYQYGVQSIPYNFLIDPQGIIIAEDIRGKALFDALNKYVR